MNDALLAAITDVADTDGEYVVTRHGEPAVVLVNHERYESLVETVNILSDAETMAAITEGRE